MLPKRFNQSIVDQQESPPALHVTGLGPQPVQLHLVTLQATHLLVACLDSHDESHKDKIKRTSTTQLQATMTARVGRKRIQPEERSRDTTPK